MANLLLFFAERLCMRFRSPLTEAILLKRHWRFLAEIALKSQKRMMIYCPNTGPLVSCDLLGSRLWFARALDFQKDCLPVWELVEADGGHLACVNKEHRIPLVVEGITRGVIQELQGYNFLQANAVYGADIAVDLILKQQGEPCFINIEAVTWCTSTGDGQFPDSQAVGTERLLQLMHIRAEGHRAVMLYCVPHNGVQRLRPSAAVDPNYGHVLQAAMARGVEVLVYRGRVDLQSIELDIRLPFVGLAAGLS